jgi:hypothetical protein
VELQGLTLVVHRTDEVVGLLEPVVFGATVRAALAALTAVDGDIRLAAQDADPAVADLLHRVAVEEPDEDPLPTVAQLVVDAARRTAGSIDAAARADAAAHDMTAWAERTRASTWLRQEADRLWALREARHLALPDLSPLVAWLAAYEQAADETGEEGHAHG